MVFVTLLRIELTRSRVWLLIAVLLLAFAVTDIRSLLWGTGGGVTWYWIGGTAGRLTGVFPFGVAFASWYAGRARRNHLNEIDRSNRWLGLGSHAIALSSLFAVLTLTVLPVFVVVSRRILGRSMDQTGGPPIGPYPWLQLVVILVAFPSFMVWGYWLGYRVGSMLTPILSATAVLLVLQVPQSISTPGEPISPLSAIIPTWLNHEMAPYIGDHVYLPLAAWALGRFILLGLIPLLLLRSRAKRQNHGHLQSLIASILAVVCAVNVTTAFEDAGPWHAKNRTQICIEQSAIKFCAPPEALNYADLEGVADHYDASIPGWFPERQIPDSMMPGISDDQLRPDAVSMIRFDQVYERSPTGFTRALLYLIAGEGVTELNPTAAQLVVTCAMLLDTGHDCGPSYPVADFQFVPDSSGSVEGQNILAPFFEPGEQPTDDEEQEIVGQLEELQTLTQQKLDNFMALSDEEKSAWLEANWDQLSAGELTLEDMP